MAAAVARLGMADGGQARQTVTLGGQSAGQNSGQAGQRQHGEQQNEQGSKADKILDRTAGVVA